MQKAGEPENDAGFPKHNSSICPLTLDYSGYIFRLHIYGISKWLLMQLTHAHIGHTATARVSPHVHSTCTSYVLCAYLYCVYALVGGAISICDPYNYQCRCRGIDGPPMGKDSPSICPRIIGPPVHLYILGQMDPHGPLISG